MKNLLYLSMLSFLLVSTTSLLIIEPKVIPTSEKVLETVSYDPLPVLENFQSPPIVSAQGVMAIDLDSRVVLYEKNADLPLLPASTTKIMTALVALDYYPLDMYLRVDGVRVEGQKMGLIYGEEIRVEDLLNGLLIFSANDAAEVLAKNYPGGRDNFIKAMNYKSLKYGLKNTYFSNPSGLDENDQVSTAKDLVYLAEVALRNPIFSRIVATKEKIVKSRDGVIVHRLTNINELLRSVDGVLGVKTGWTENARENLVTYVERDNRKVLISLLGSQNRFGETKEIIDWIFESYVWREIQPPSP